MTTIYYIGDSTVAKNTIHTYPQTGMSQGLDRYIGRNVRIESHAKNGRSTRSFLKEGRFAPVEQAMGKGDFLFIQFGHNDEKPDKARHTDPNTREPLILSALPCGFRIWYNNTIKAMVVQAMKQETFTDIEYSFRKKKTKREEFLEIMDEIIPWDEWVGVIKPYYPKGKRGRPPMGIEKMLRMYLLQIWFNLSDPATEDAIYDSYAMRKFTGIDFMTEAVPDETTLCNFRHLLEAHGLNKLFFDAINRVMVQTGHMMKGGTIVDATIINAPSSTKNAAKARDSEMHQTKKGNEWKFGMKCHIGVDACSGLVHTITVTAANEHDITQAAALIREDDEVVYGDSGYLGIQKRPEVTSDAHLSSIDYRINRRPGKLPHVSDNAIDWERYIENRKSSVRCKVEHAFRIIKCQFGYKKTVYRGLKKNENRLYAMFACANLYALAIAGRKLATT